MFHPNMSGLGCICTVEWVDQQHEVKIKGTDKGMMATGKWKYGGTDFLPSTPTF